MTETSAETTRPCVLITGAGRRIGKALALSLCHSGWHVAVHYRRSGEAAAEVVREIRQSGGKAVSLACDLANAEDVAKLIPRCAEALSPPACLINNASLFLKDEIGTLTPELWQTHIDTNLRAPVLLAQSLAQHLPSGQRGHVINIIDQRVLRPAPDFFSYSVSKAGLWWATQTMAQGLAPHVRVNAVAPGPVLRSIHQSADEFEAEQSGTLLRHGAHADDIVRAVHFLLETPSITGQMICVDGGQHLS